MSAPLVLSDVDFSRLRALLARLAGLVFDDARRDSLAYSVAERLRATGARTVGDYLDVVEATGSTERQHLLDEVTIQETHFFRNPPQVRALRAYVVPQLVRTAAAADRRLRIWSAGCSTGEEAYTVAMLLRELLPSTEGWDVKVLATDVSARALDAARTGRYGTRAVQMATSEELGRFFVPLDDGRFEVRPEVRDLVEFRHHNLVTEPAPFGPDERLDLVLCRNVTIYFGRDTTRALMSRLHAALRDGGYLFLGHSETLWQISDEFRLVSLGSGESAAFVYRRLDPPRDGAPTERRQVLPDRRTEEELLSAAERRTGPRRAGEVPAFPPPARDTAESAPAEREPDAEPERDVLRPARLALTEARYDAAARLAGQVAVRNPLYTPAHRLRGEALVALGQDDEALVALRKAIYLDPEDGMAHFLLAGALARLGDTAAAVREYGAAAGVLRRRPRGVPAPELDGRDVEELVALCVQLGAKLEDRQPAAREMR
jgi:chemotaxis protein methyltransferase CheR